MFEPAGRRPDPEGTQWIRNLMRALAAEGASARRPSPHLMSEMESTADHLIAIYRGKLISRLLDV